MAHRNTVDQSQVTTDSGFMVNPMSLLKTTPFKTQQKTTGDWRIPLPDGVESTLPFPTEHMWPQHHFEQLRNVQLFGCTVVISLSLRFMSSHLW